MKITVTCLKNNTVAVSQFVLQWEEVNKKYGSLSTISGQDRESVCTIRSFASLSMAFFMHDCGPRLQFPIGEKSARNDRQSNKYAFSFIKCFLAMF